MRIMAPDNDRERFRGDAGPVSDVLRRAVALPLVRHQNPAMADA
jgi:hypothetical protein